MTIDTKKSKQESRIIALDTPLEQLSHVERLPGTSIVLINRNHCDQDCYEMDTNSITCVDFSSGQQNEY